MKLKVLLVGVNSDNQKTIRLLSMCYDDTRIGANHSLNLFYTWMIDIVEKSV